MSPVCESFMLKYARRYVTLMQTRLQPTPPHIFDGIRTMMHDRSHPPSRPTRRQFVAASAGLTAGGLAALTAAHSAVAQDADSESKNTARLIKAGDTILFQGDSITDAGRKREDNIASQPNHQPAMGEGYAWLAAATLLLDRPGDDLKIFNRGISGNKVHELDERWQEDCVALRPDVVSILIGVNDIWHTINGKFDSTVEKYVARYRTLVERTRRELPDARIVICEPFVTRTGAVNDKWFPEFDGYRGAAERIAKEIEAPFVEFQKMFDAASKIAAPEHWAYDGVHPTWAGAAMMAHTWLKTVGA